MISQSEEDLQKNAPNVDTMSVLMVCVLFSMCRKRLVDGKTPLYLY